MVKKITEKEAKELKNKNVNPFEQMEDELNQLEEDFEDTVKNLTSEADKIIDETEEIEFNPELLVDRIFEFGELLSDTKLYDYQKPPAKKLIEDILLSKGSRITIHFPRQSGKTQIFKVVLPACAVLLPKLYNIFPKKLWAFKDGFYAGIFALSTKTSSTMFSRIQDVFSSDHAKPFLQDPDLDLKVKKTNPVKLSNLSMIRAHTMLAKILVSYSYHIMVIDEADKALDTDRLTTDIQPMGAAYNGTFVMLGTAGEHECLFHKYIEENKDVEINTGVKNHFQISYQKAMKQNPLYRKYMESVLRDLEKGVITQDSFDRSYGLIWKIDDRKFITRERFQVMLDSTQQLYYDGKSEFLKNTELVAGLDLGKSTDKTVLTILKLIPIEGSNRHYKQIVSWFELFKVKYSEQRRRIVEFITRFPVTLMYADSTGVGEVFTDELIESLEDWYMEIKKFIFSDKSKSNGYSKLQDIIDRDELIIPGSYKSKQTETFKHFKSDFLACEKVYKKSYMMIEAPESDKTKHDDYIDSLMLANLAASELIEMGDFEITDNDFYSFTDGGNEEWQSIF